MPPETRRGERGRGRCGRCLDAPLTPLPRGNRLHLGQHSRSDKWKALFSVLGSDF